MYLDREEQQELILKLTSKNLAKNEILKLNSLSKSINNGYFFLPENVDLTAKEILKEIKQVSGRFFSSIDNDNIYDVYCNIDEKLMDDFWELFEVYRLYEKINSDNVNQLIEKDRFALYTILHLAKTVAKYGVVVKKQLMNFVEVSEVIIDFYFSEGQKSQKVYLPVEITRDDKIQILKQYIEWERSNPNYLALLMQASISKSEYPITKEIKQLAKQKYNDFWTKSFEKNPGMEFGVEIIFCDQSEVKTEKYNEGTCTYRYDRKWIEENQDYPTLWNNFIYLFDFVNAAFLSNAYSRPNEMGIFESIGIKGKRWYKKGIAFDMQQQANILKLMAYEIELKKYNIELDSLLQWFFTTYLKEEFDIDDFYYQPINKESSYIEKNILLCCAIDNILKQYNLFCEKGKIEREYFEIGAEAILIEQTKSLVENKYAYATRDKGKVLEQEASYLIGQNHALSYCEKLKGTKKAYKNLLELLTRETIYLDDFYEYQQEYIKFLIERGSVVETDNGLKVRTKRATVLTVLYKQGVLPIHYLLPVRSVVEELLASGELEIESTLFSRQEQEYLSFLLNNHNFDNGLSLRNRYIHGTYSLNPDKNKGDYYLLLSIIFLIGIKINDELCLLDYKKDKEKNK